jgi:L,D-transpeptidase catalytic domain
VVSSMPSSGEISVRQLFWNMTMGLVNKKAGLALASLRSRARSRWLNCTNRPTSDVGLMRYYHLSGTVVVVSFIEQICRIYQNGKLIKAFQVTTGNFDSPSPAGLWHIFLRQSPTVFRSSAPFGSHFCYPDTPITYAMEYHVGGYYLHDSWWRTDYGPRTNFPHYDPNGNRYAAEGSHGCINMPYADAA